MNNVLESLIQAKIIYNSAKQNTAREQAAHAQATHEQAAHECSLERAIHKEMLARLRVDELGYQYGKWCAMLPTSGMF